MELKCWQTTTNLYNINNMARPKKIQRATTRVVDENDQIVEVSEVGLPGLFPAQQWDIEEEFANNEALREYQRERQSEF